MIKPVLNSVVRDVSKVVVEDSAFSLAAYWKIRDNFYELWKVIGSGEMTGLIEGDTLTITGVGLDAIYAVPDNATYKALDTDYCFFKSNGDVSTACDGNRLIGYDFPRIIVFYLDVAPYTIQYIGILNAGQSVNNKMRDDFHLSVWWDDTLSLHGSNKQNKPLPQKYTWTPESVYQEESTALFARMLALDEEPTDARKTIIDTAIAADKGGNGFTDLYDCLWLTASHGTLSSRLNIIKDAHNITLVSTPTFLADRHWVGNGTDAALNCNFNPSSQAVKYLQNAASFGFYLRNNVDGLYDVMSALAGASIGISVNIRYADQKYIRMNSDYAASANNDSSGMWIFSRTASNSYAYYHNGVLGDLIATPSAALPDAILHLLARNLSGTLSQFAPYQLALAFVGGVMDQTKVTAFQNIWIDGYLDSIGAKI